MGLILRVLAVATLIACNYAAQTAANEGPAYQRHRSQSHRSSAAYGYESGAGHSWHYPSYPGIGYGYYQQPTSGYWFERPYPYHLDYYRVRSSSPAQNCPCAESPAPTQAVAPSPATAPSE